MSYESVVRKYIKAAQKHQRPTKSTEIETFIIVGGQQSGPFTSAELKMLVKKGNLTQNTLVWCAGYSEWLPAKFVPHVNKHFLLHCRKAESDESLSHREGHPMLKDLISAISQLGYPKQQAHNVAIEILKQTPKIELSEAVKQSLKYLSESRH